MAALAGEQSQNIEIQNPAGRWLSLRILPYRGPANAIDGAIATLIDIDDLKRARDFAEAVVGVVREPLIVLDAALRVRTANQAFYQVFQLEAQDIEGRLIYEIGGGQWNIPKLRQLLEEILPKHKSMMDFQLEQNYMGIGTKTMVLHAREIRHGDRERLILLAIDDITELRQFADNLRKTNEDLKQFIYAASHDLQEPIRMIVSYTDLLNQRYGDKLGKEGGLFINYAVEGAQRLEALIAGLREFWQLSERVDEQPASVDCNEVLQTVLLNLEKSIAESGAVVTADPLPSVMASPAPLIQLFQNLIGNAIKYRSDQPPRIGISATKSPPNGFSPSRTMVWELIPNMLRRYFACSRDSIPAASIQVPESAWRFARRSSNDMEAGFGLSLIRREARSLSSPSPTAVPDRTQALTQWFSEIGEWQMGGGRYTTPLPLFSVIRRANLPNSITCLRFRRQGAQKRRWILCPLPIPPRSGRRSALRFFDR